MDGVSFSPISQCTTIMGTHKKSKCVLLVQVSCTLFLLLFPALVSGSLFSPIFKEESFPSQGCENDTKICPDGKTKVKRDQQNKCQFAACPGGIATLVQCTNDAKECPDGSVVTRDSTNHCEFLPCLKEPTVKKPSSRYSCWDNRERTECLDAVKMGCIWISRAHKCVENSLSGCAGMPSRRNCILFGNRVSNDSGCKWNHGDNGCLPIRNKIPPLESQLEHDCTTVSCSRPDCGPGEELVTPTMECCPVCVACQDMKCKQNVCAPGEHEVRRAGECCPTCTADCNSVECPIAECGANQQLVPPAIGECCHKCVDCSTFPCEKLVCAKGDEFFTPKGTCCPICADGCGHVECPFLICGANGVAHLAEGDCCPRCAIDCTLVTCVKPSCQVGEMRRKDPLGCCEVCSKRDAINAPEDASNGRPEY